MARGAVSTGCDVLHGRSLDHTTVLEFRCSQFRFGTHVPSTTETQDSARRRCGRRYQRRRRRVERTRSQLFRRKLAHGVRTFSLSSNSRPSRVGCRSRAAVVLVLSVPMLSPSPLRRRTNLLTIAVDFWVVGWRTLSTADDGAVWAAAQAGSEGGSERASERAARLPGRTRYQSASGSKSSKRNLGGCHDVVTPV